MALIEPWESGETMKLQIPASRFTSRVDIRLLAGALLAVALLFTFNPELRVLLLFVDSLGIELLAALCALQFRYGLEVLVAMMLIPVLRSIYRWGPVPGFWPTRTVLTSSASWAGYAILYPAAAVCFAALLLLSLISPLYVRF
jgi:hypothetical protein